MPPLAQALARRSTLAFLLLAALAALDHTLLWQASWHARGGAALVSALGRQRAASDEIALAGSAAVAAASAEERAGWLARLRVLHPGWPHRHAELAPRAAALAPAAGAELSAVTPVVARMAAEAARLEALLAATSDAAGTAERAALAAYVADQARYVRAMDAAAAALSRDLDARTRRAGTLTLGFLGLGLAVLGVLYAGSLRPAARALARAYDALSAQRGRLLDQNGRLEAQHAELLAQRAALERQAEELERLSTVVRQTDDAVSVTDVAGRLTWANAAWERMTGWAAADALGRAPAELLRCADTHPDVAGGIAAAVAGGSSYAGEALLQRRDGTRFWAAHTLTPVRRADGQLTGFVAIERDVTEHKRHEHALEQLSLRDELTGLYNRRGFHVMARHALEMASRAGTPCLLLCGDVDGLKPVNDRLGHDAGDALLAEVAAVLRSTFRASDVVARLGGDEFVVLAHGAAGETAEHVRARLDARLAAASARPGRRYPVAMSVGCEPVPPGTVEGLDRLMRLADAALYRDKRLRRARGARRQES